MLCMRLENINPFFCLAAEEFLLKNFSEEIFLLWQSNNAIIVGKHQNALAEINYPYVHKNNITVARRISGGGTVFHDKGNVNFTYIKNVESTEKISFKKFTEPIIQALGELGVEAKNSGRNDISINGIKVSGNAEHIFRNRVLHHGTLLYNSDLEKLKEAIKVIKAKYQSKAIQSNRSTVANISDFMDTKLNMQDFINHLYEFHLKVNPQYKTYSFTSDEKTIISQLANEKFSTWKWRYGYSPKYTFQNRYEKNGKELQIEIWTEKGKIKICDLKGNLFPKSKLSDISDQLTGKRHCYEDIFPVLEHGVSISEELVFSFF